MTVVEKKGEAPIASQHDPLTWVHFWHHLQLQRWLQQPSARACLCLYNAHRAQPACASRSQLAHHQSSLISRRSDQETVDGEAAAGSAPLHGAPGGLARRLGHARRPCRGRQVTGHIYTAGHMCNPIVSSFQFAANNLTAGEGGCVVQGEPQQGGRQATTR